MTLLLDVTDYIERRGVSRLPDLWGEERAMDCPVWRLEFQVRREALAEF